MIVASLACAFTWWLWHQTDLKLNTKAFEAYKSRHTVKRMLPTKNRWRAPSSSPTIFLILILQKGACGFHSLSSLPHSIFLHPSKKLLPAIVIRAHTDPLSLQSPSNMRDTKQKPRGIYWPQPKGVGAREEKNRFFFLFELADVFEKNEKKNKTTSVYRLSSHMEEKKINVSFKDSLKNIKNTSLKSLTGKDNFFVSEWLRQQGRKLCEIFES